MPDLTLSEQPIYLTIGDPQGIGPEIAARFLHSQAKTGLTRPVKVIGDIPNLVQTAERLQLVLPEVPKLQYMNIQTESSTLKPPGEIAYESLNAAVSAIHQHHSGVLVTGPISKQHLQEANLPFSGHTEILQHLARKAYHRPCQSDMLFLYRNFRMLLLTRHVALRKVPEALSIQGVVRSLSNLAVFFQQQCGITHPRWCVLGVNPHAGELEGDEEDRILKPALAIVSKQFGLNIEPPVPADAAFRYFDVERIQYDAYVAAYHDQGLIPFKMVAGLNAVNVTIGLPFLRTSVSHGTAPDIVGQGTADPASLVAAYQMALQLTAHKATAKVDASAVLTPLN